MPGPFPGFDPFLEDQGYWREFHTVYMSWMQDAIAERLPDEYEVRIEERLSLSDGDDDAPDRDVQPDALVLRSPQSSRRRPAPTMAPTREPVPLTLPPRQVEEVIEKRLSIRRSPHRELVTAIELLSPSDKRPPGNWLLPRR